MKTSSKKMLRLTVILLSALTVSSLLLAAKVKHMNLLELVSRADKIFSGEVVNVQESTISVPGGGTIPCTIYTVMIQDRIRGGEAETVTFRYVGSPEMKVRGKYGYKFEVPGMPRYQRSDEILLFLNQESTLQLTAPMGLFQGSFRIYADPKTGRRMVVNGSDNAGLFKNMTAKDLPGVQNLSRAELELLHVNKGPLDYQTFVDLVRKLAQ
ncbi:MAG: hypothetical protein ACE5IY_07385 [bacterium]